MVTLLCALLPAILAADAKTYQGELVRFTGPWSFQRGRASIILVNEAIAPKAAR